MLVCRFYSISTDLIDEESISKSTYADALRDLVENVKRFGTFETDVPLFQRRDIYDTLQEVDSSIVGRDFFGVLLTCASPKGVLDRFDEGPSEFGYLKEAIVQDAATDITDYLTKNQGEGFAYDFVFGLSKALNAARQKELALVMFYEDVEVESVSEDEPDRIQKKGKVATLFKRFGKKH